MYTVYFDFNLRKKICFKKMGIIIRNATKKEKKFIIDNIVNIYAKKDELQSFYEKNKDISETSIKYLLEIEKIKSDEVRELIIASFGLLKSGFVFNNIDYIKQIVNKLVIIEVDSSKFLELGIKDEKKFISNILSLNEIYESPLLNKNVPMKKDYSFILEDNPLDKTDKYFIHGLMLSFIFNYSKVKYKTIKEVTTTNGFLLNLEKFINSLDINGISKFIDIIDLLFCDYTMMQNAIISNITIVESLIIREKEDIEKAFVLKGGLILKKFLSPSSNNAVSSLLKFTYDIRSDIVHGNYEKILKDLNTINQKTKATKKFVEGTNGTIDKKAEAYKIAFTISTLISRSVIKYWIENKNDIEYMKNN